MKFKVIFFLLAFCFSKIAYSQWNPKPNWKDSFEANGLCWCDSNGYDHGLDTKTYVLNGTPYLIPDICEELENHPLYRAMQDGDIPYNDIQCGNGPANDAADEAGCPGRVDIGPDGCDDIGPLWDIAWLESRPIFGGGNVALNNVALNGIATQSSTDYEGDASRAIDDNTSGVWSEGSVTHTDAGQPPHWWQVDLGAPYAIEEIQIYGRTDSCCQARLSNYDVYILNCSGHIVWSNYQADYPDPAVFLDAEGTIGRYVKVQLQGSTVALSLAEVRVLSETPAGYCGDLTLDGKVNLEDYAALSAGWQSSYTMDDLFHLVNDWLAGMAPYSLWFDGLDDYMKIPGYNGISGSQPRTVSAWVKTDLPATNQTIIHWGTDATGQLWLFYILADGKLALAGYGGGVMTNAIVADGQWHHVAAVLEAGQNTSDAVKLYVDGQLDAVPFAGVCTLNTTTDSPVHIGVWNRPVAADKIFYFQGHIDDVRIYDRALSAVEIDSIATTEDGLVAHWELNEGSGNIARDYVSGYTGVIHGAQWNPE